MGLSKPVKRKHYHTRKITVEGFFREDGLWDIEGHMADTKTYAFSNNDRGTLEPGDPVHNMHLRITLDDTLTVRDAEADAEHTPYRICPNIAPVYKELIGLRIGPGWNRELKKKFAGVRGCTHITELLGPMATVAFQTVYGSGPQARKDHGIAEPNYDPTRRPGHLDGCHALETSGPIVKENYPRFYTGNE